jgi:hypothetical protein
MRHDWSARGGFFANADFDFEARIVLAAAPSGVGDGVGDGAGAEAVK